MATDLAFITNELAAFHDFSDKTVVVVGAGGGRLVRAYAAARRIIAIDHDSGALEQLQQSANAEHMRTPIEMLHADFMTVEPQGDVVVFEFSLHEFAEPERALAHALQLALDLVVIDHATGSPWMLLAGEHGQVATAWHAVASRSTRKARNIAAWQQFNDLRELQAKLGGHPINNKKLIASYRKTSSIEIPMPCRIIWLQANRGT